MKIKTSITITDSILQTIDKTIDSNSNRSIFIENAVKYYLLKLRKIRLDKKDAHIIDKNYLKLNTEAEDVLSYQD